MYLRFKRNVRGNALLAVMVIITGCLIVLGAALSWTSGSKKTTERYNQYTRSLAAAEAATEKVIVAINSDYKNQGQAYVLRNLDQYRMMTPTSSEDPIWRTYRFTDYNGTGNRVQVDFISGTNLTAISPQYRGLLGFPCKFKIVATAQEMKSPIVVRGGVEQQVQVSLIPIYQFAMFYNLDYECNALPVIDITGPVHCNGSIYLTPVSTLTFWNDVTCTGKILKTAKSGNTFGTSGGTVVFKGASDGGVSNLTLPIGTNNSLAAVREVVEVPPGAEDPNSPMGQQRFFNKADMVILVSNLTVSVTSGRFNNFAVPVSFLEAATFVNTNVSFYNGREKKTVKCTQLDIGKLAAWNASNTVLRPILPSGDLRVIYIADFRTQSATTEAGIRLTNGLSLLPQGLTIATPHPLYVFGNYNCPNAAHLNTTNTSATKPAALIADAITVLSPAWDDSKSSGSLGTRGAQDTTVNAAFVAGIVQTTPAAGYSGGVENFPRFLEDWNNKRLTYSGSMVVMFESKYATAPWVNIGIYYNPPIRNWAFDTNFRDPTKLPPATPSAYALSRGTWDIAVAK